MFDSIHSARWLSQFIDCNEVEIFIFPSRKFRNLNPELNTLLQRNVNIRVTKFHSWIPRFLLGYYSYFRFELIAKLIGKTQNELRARSLKEIYESVSPNIVHALEIQGAGYLVADMLAKSRRPEKAIITNWGSDIYFYGKFESEKKRIIECLNEFTHYSAECHRDYELALTFEFKGKMLPCMPNGGGIIFERIESPSPLSSSRNLLLVKAYGGKFGLGDIALSISEKILASSAVPNVYFYSVTNDLEPKVKELVGRFPSRVDYSTVRRGLSHESLIEKFKYARCYLGMSRSDGVSTSFLEALTYGAYPIQTDTSCAAEWVDLGAIGFIAGPNDDSLIVKKIQEVFLNDELVDTAQLTNNNLAKKYLSFEYLKSKSRVFYE